MTGAQERAAIVDYLDAMADRVKRRANERLRDGQPQWEADAGAYVALEAVARLIEQAKHLPGRAVPGASGRG